MRIFVIVGPVLRSDEPRQKLQKLLSYDQPAADQPAAVLNGRLKTTAQGRRQMASTPYQQTTTVIEIGRGERIRTSDSCVPNAVLYQAELRPDRNTVLITSGNSEEGQF